MSEDSSLTPNDDTDREECTFFDDIVHTADIIDVNDFAQLQIYC